MTAISVAQCPLEKPVFSIARMAAAQGFPSMRPFSIDAALPSMHATGAGSQGYH